MSADEKFFAWLDGELPPAEAAGMEERVAADPELARLAAEHRAMQAELRSAFDPLLAAPVPERLIPRSPPAEVVSLADARAAREFRRAVRQPLWKQAAAMAATLALGILAGSMLVPRSSGSVGVEAERMVADGALEEALYARLASAQPDEGPRIGITFRNVSGAVCRTFSDRAASGLACHEGGDWRIRGLFQAPEGQQGDYRMAAGMDPALAALIDETMAGEPFDSAQEKAAKEKGWR